jgi:hypothetical protein
VHARVPLDVDLEDKLLYGLTPTRLAYLIVGLLAGFAIWSAEWAPTGVRVAAAIPLAAAGAVAAWGRWRGRPVDGWLIDLAVYAVSNYRLVWRLPRRPKRH